MFINEPYRLLIMSTMDALAVVAEEGRMHAYDIVGEAVSSLRSGSFPMGKPIPMQIGIACGESVLRKRDVIVAGRAPSELKHLSRVRKRNHMRFRQ